MQIFKFGGASVRDANAVRNLEDVILKFGNEKTLVVVSAMDKTTSNLEELLGLLVEGAPYEQKLDEVLSFHREIISELQLTATDRYEYWEKSLKECCTYVADIRPDRLWAYDQLVSHGELMSTSIIQAYLSDKTPCEWLDAREMVRTDQYFTEANIDWVVTERQIKSYFDENADGLIVTQGFIGRDQEGNTTTLGREGSDFTGSIFAHCLNADSFTVWKDVRGILNADPRIMKNTEKYNHLSYREITEMTYYGAQVIHPKTLKPLAQKSIPLVVRSFADLDQDGTLISGQSTSKTIPCFVFKGNQLLVTAEAKDHNFMNEQKLGMILQVLDLLNIKINLMQNSALTFSFCIDNKEFKAKRIKELLNRDFNLSFESNLNLATIKNYQDDSFAKLPEEREVLMEQKTADNYQVLYR